MNWDLFHHFRETFDLKLCYATNQLPTWSTDCWSSVAGAGHENGQVENSEITETSESDFRCFLFRVFVWGTGYIRKLGRWKLGKYFPRFPRNPSFRIATFDWTFKRVSKTWRRERVFVSEGGREGGREGEKERVKPVSYVSLIPIPSFRRLLS